MTGDDGVCVGGRGAVRQSNINGKRVALFFPHLFGKISSILYCKSDHSGRDQVSFGKLIQLHFRYVHTNMI